MRWINEVCLLKGSLLVQEAVGGTFNFNKACWSLFYSRSFPPLLFFLTHSLLTLRRANWLITGPNSLFYTQYLNNLLLEDCVSSAPEFRVFLKAEKIKQVTVTGVTNSGHRKKI